MCAIETRGDVRIIPCPFHSSLLSQAWYIFELFKPFSPFAALADLHSRAWNDIQSSARQNKVVCLSESPESGRWKKGIAKVLPQQIYSGILTVDYEGMYLVHEIFLCSRHQKPDVLGWLHILLSDCYLSLGTEMTPHHWTDMKLAIWRTKAWAKKTWNRRIR